jgi:hypothetical protein
MILFFATVPVGMLLGPALGIPVALVTVALVAGRSTTLDPARFVRDLSIAGLVIALAASAIALIPLLAITVTVFEEGGAGLGAALLHRIGASINVTAAIGLVGANGWMGREVSRRHLRRLGRELPTPGAPRRDSAMSVAMPAAPAPMPMDGP